MIFETVADIKWKSTVEELAYLRNGTQVPVHDCHVKTEPLQSSPLPNYRYNNGEDVGGL